MKNQTRQLTEPLVIRQVSAGACACGQAASKQIGAKVHCAHCGDKLLMKLILAGIAHLEEVTINYTVVPLSTSGTAAPEHGAGPVEGIFYLVPDPRSGRYTFLSERADDPVYSGEQVNHLFLWSAVLDKLRIRFRNADVNAIADAYTGIPRGRIVQRAGRHAGWVVGHGNDFVLDEFRESILAAFSLNTNEVQYEVQGHEKMVAADKALVQKTLGIVMTPKGFSVNAAVKKAKRYKPTL